jgi:hypothetical protein
MGVQPKVDYLVSNRRTCLKDIRSEQKLCPRGIEDGLRQNGQATGLRAADYLDA